jgi:4-hydroxybenzoate polyprenyltransferase
MNVLKQLRKLLEMIRFSHTLFALPFALLAGAMAWRAGAADEPPMPFRPVELVAILLCMVFARSAAMAMNRLADRRLDAENPRTAGRHLPTGTLKVATVVWFTVLSALGFIASTLLFLPRNPLPVIFSVPVLLFLFGYSYAKRFTSGAHFWLGAALMLAPLGAWVAVRPAWNIAPLLLGLAVLFWVAGFDMIYACQDYSFDRKKRLRSIPARWGIRGALRMAAVSHAAMILCLMLLGLSFPWFGGIYFSGIGLIVVLLVYEHSVVRPYDLARVNLAFFHLNALISVGLLVIGSIDLVW